MDNLQERLRQMASIAITHPQFTDYVNNALEAALEAADALDQKDAEIERLRKSNNRLHINGTNDGLLIDDLKARIAKLEAVLEAAENEFIYTKRHNREDCRPAWKHPLPHTVMDCWVRCHTVGDKIVLGPIAAAQEVNDE